jgi:hypothetical protein
MPRSSEPVQTTARKRARGHRRLDPLAGSRASEPWWMPMGSPRHWPATGRGRRSRPGRGCCERSAWCGGRGPRPGCPGWHGARRRRPRAGPAVSSMEMSGSGPGSACRTSRCPPPESGPAPAGPRPWPTGRRGASPAPGAAAAPAAASADRRASIRPARGFRRRSPAQAGEDARRVVVADSSSARLSGVVSRICGGSARWRRRAVGVSPVRSSTRIARPAPSTGRAQVAADVGGQRLQRRDVQRVQPGRRRRAQFGQRGQEPRQRLAAAGGARSAGWTAPPQDLPPAAAGAAGSAPRGGGGRGIWPSSGGGRGTWSQPAGRLWQSRRAFAGEWRRGGNLPRRPGRHLQGRRSRRNSDRCDFCFWAM